MKTLIIIQNQEGIINIISRLIVASCQINNNCDVLLIGYQLKDDIIHEITKYVNVNKVLVVDNNILENIVVENISRQISNIVRQYTHVLINADSFGKNLLPRIAGQLQISQVSEVVNIISPNIFERFIYAGNILVQLESYEDIKLLTVRSNLFGGHRYDKLLIADKIDKTKLHYIDYDKTQICDKIKFISNNIIKNTQDLTSAKIIISGGRSLLSKENFDNLIIKLADKYNAAVGATRSAVEAGFISNDHQVGQTGKIVHPNLYISFGVSGAIQHIAGMKGAKKVISINNDPQAPIFEYSDFGFIGDLFDVIPQLLK
jgi:electron transfer flavoprotein alpha subunit